ncbi:MAG: twin-arginine translocase TatA/TatE family subunit [Aggregatilineales bacterium]
MNFNILGIGLPQLIIVGGLALVLFGPKKMVQYAYQAGRMLSQLRVMWEEAARNVQKEFKEAGLDLPKDLTKVGGFDIGAAAMKVVQGTPSVPVVPVVPPSPILSPEPLTAVPTPSIEQDLPAAPSLNAPPTVDTNDGNEKYDAWLPK